MGLDSTITFIPKGCESKNCCEFGFFTFNKNPKNSKLYCVKVCNIILLKNLKLIILAHSFFKLELERKYKKTN